MDGVRLSRVRVCLLALLLLALALFLHACAGFRSGDAPVGQASPPADPQSPVTEVLLPTGSGGSPAAGPSVTLPALPGSSGDNPVAGQPVSPSRRVSDSQRTVDGAGFVSASAAGVSVEGTAGIIIPGEDDPLAWVLYTLDGMELERPAGLDLSIQLIIPGEDDPLIIIPGEDDPLRYWVLLSDYSSNRWEAHGPFVEPASLTLNSAAVRQRYVSKREGAEQPRFSFAVVVQPGPGRDGSIPPEQQPRLRVASAAATVRSITDPAYFRSKPLPARLSGVTADAQTGAVSVHLVPGAADGADKLYVQRRLAGTGDTWEELGSVPAAASSYSDPGDNTVGAAAGPQPGESYDYRAVSAADDGGEELRAGYSNQQGVSMPGNLLPTAVLQASSTSIQIGMSISFNASASHDADGTITDYEWDFDGDGVFNEPGDEAAAQGNATPAPVSYAADGSFTPVVRVTDDAGGQDSASVSISVNLPATYSVSGTVRRVGAQTGLPGVTVQLAGGGSAVTDSSGNYSIGSVGAGTRTLTPSPSAWTFDPPNRQVDVVDENLSSLDFDAYSAPVADLQASATEGDAPLSVSFDASGSFDPDDGVVPGLGIVDYEWDFDYNGTYNEPGAEADARGNPTPAAVIFNTPGHQTIRLRVTDNDGASSIQSTNVIPKGWRIVVVDEGSGVGGYNSLAIVNGHPAISYWDGGNNDLKYAWSSTEDGADESDWITLTVDSDGDTGSYSSLTMLANGNPAIAYRDSNPPSVSLKYAWSSEADGSGGWTTLTIDSHNAHHTSLAVINGTPAISYLYSGPPSSGLKYAWSNTVDGSSGWDMVMVEIGSAGGYNSLAVANGNPAIGYYAPSGADLKYAWSTEPDGSGDWSTLIADTRAGYYASLVILDNDRPAISYYDIDYGNLEYAWSTEPDGSSGWSTLIVEAEVGYSMNRSPMSLAVISGKPAISYYDTTGQDLRYTWSSEADGSSGWSTLTVDDSDGLVGADNSLAALANGSPAISYYQITPNYALKYAVLIE